MHSLARSQAVGPGCHVTLHGVLHLQRLAAPATPYHTNCAKMLHLL
jgi:hypothetical protein